MGAIRNTSTGQTHILESDCLVGRVTGSLTLNEAYVSSVHAELRWNGQSWELKDLGSRNGTYLDGRRVEPTMPNRIARSSRIAFGKTQQEWEMLDDTAPQVMAIPLEGGQPALLDGELIPLPSSSDPQAMIYRTIEGMWVLETPESGAKPLVHNQSFEACGRLWRFSCPDIAKVTLASSDPVDFALQVSRLHLAFSVSLDEEYVHIRGTCGRRDFDFGARRHNFLLLTLARQRLEDARQGLSDAACGWMEVEDLARDPSMAPPQLNIDVYRIRDQFAKEGIVDAAALIERRPQPRQIRIGTGHVTIARI